MKFTWGATVWLPRIRTRQLHLNMMPWGWLDILMYHFASILPLSVVPPSFYAVSTKSICMKRHDKLASCLIEREANPSERIMRKLSRLTAIRISKPCARARGTHIAPELDTARAPAARRAGRRSKREARARSQSTRLKWEAGAGAIKARALYTSFKR